MKITKPTFEILTPIDAGYILRHIERCTRTAYKSEDKIGPGSAEKLIASVLKRGHESVVEHFSFSVRFICDRGISHEIVRHRMASYTQESTRYCVAGDMSLKTTNPHSHLTVAGLYDNKANSNNGAWKRIKIETYNPKTGELCFNNVKDVFMNGERECVKIKTKLGYEIVCTPDHKIYSADGFKEANDLTVGDRILVNGTEKLYKNREWLYHQSITLNKTFTQISCEFGYSSSVLKKWARKHGIPKKGTGYFNVGRTPWNKDIQNDNQVEALRKYHHCGRRNDKILKEDTSVYQKRTESKCKVCGATEGLEVHHIDKNRDNNSVDNLITLCGSCHQRIHSRNLTVAYADEIVSIQNVGKRDVYDIEIDSEFHNFVANGIVVHNCNYGKDQFGSEITVIKPFYLDESTPAYAAWKRACEAAEQAYFDILDWGCSPQEARAVLPNSLKTEIIMTANIREWRHFFKLRCSAAAHPQIREIAVPLLTEMKSQIPVLFDDICPEVFSVNA